MNNIERLLLSLLDALRTSPTGDVAAVRSDVVALTGVACTLDEADQRQRGILGLFEYLDVTTQDAVAGGAAWQAPQRLGVENALRSILAANRRADSVFALSCVRDELERSAVRIGEMKPGHREPLHGLLGYVDMKNQQSLDLAIRRDWGELGSTRRFEMPRGTTPHQDRDGANRLIAR